ncbi:MAG: DNA mismatch repair endonuclease MutL [Chloroflexi bacterium]|nr:DNA mismatch repair endonuclease MutL [Chloroflexota bacterium]
MPIKVLPADLAGKIAAGEVVERPASVVKELVENSLDAGASQITVEIQGGGIQQIRITDDGCGIPVDQVELAFQRHATSKLDSQEQLEAMSTLGFRGEALPSMAAVSNLILTTRPAEAEAGHTVHLEWGTFTHSGPQGAAVGTSVTVSDLFGNLPARRKFLRTISTETSRVQELVSRYALAYPQTRFQLAVDGKQQLLTSGSGSPKDALAAVYGADVAEQMLDVHGEDAESGYRVDGFISPPGLNRANRTHMTFFVNRRWIQSRMLSFALEEAYHGLLPERRFPLAALNLDIPYSQVDVNSHPSKREIRFHQEGKAFSTLQRAVRAVLVADSPVPQMRPPSPIPGQEAAAPSFFPRISFGGQSGRGPGSGGHAVPYPAQSQTFDPATPRPAAPALKVVGQLKLTYIVAEGPEGMFLVDQHAAHERVLFDRLRQDSPTKGSLSQPLLEPVTVELSPAQVDVLREHGGHLEDYGFAVEHFGDNSYLLRAVPAIFTSQDPGKSLLDVLDMVAFEGLLRQQEDVLAASIACHGAIRAGKSLTEGEMRALLEQLEAAENPHTCPHGRPTMIHFSSSHMEREFGRR